MKFTIYTQEGKKKGDIELSDAIFAAPVKTALLKQVVLAFLANARLPIAHTKGRGEVSGGGKKPWKQKGTGRARHGSIRSPIWVGGGVTHGPRNDKNYGKKVNKKMARRALVSALSGKAKDGEILLVDKFTFEQPKAGQAKEVLLALSKIEGFEKLSYKKKNAALIILPQKDINVYKSFSNFGNIFVKDAANINAYDAVKYKYIIFVNPQEAQEVLLQRIENK